MLVCPVAGIDDGHGCHLAGILCSSFNEMPHHNDIGIVAHHQERVFEGFAFAHTRGFGIGKSDDAGTKSVGGCFKTKTCAGGWFEEKRSYHFSFQKLSVWKLFKLSCHVEQIHDALL